MLMKSDSCVSLQLHLLPQKKHQSSVCIVKHNRSDERREWFDVALMVVGVLGGTESGEKERKEKKQRFIRVLNLFLDKKRRGEDVIGRNRIDREKAERMGIA